MIVRKKSQTVTFLKLGFAALLAVVVVGCASMDDGDYGYLPESDTASTADGAAFTADSMMYRKGMPQHADAKPLEFYYKTCTKMDGAAFYSKTSYECSAPY